MLSQIFLAITASTFVWSAPTPGFSSANVLLERATPGPVQCGPPEDQRAWAAQAVEAAYNKLTELGPRAAADRLRIITSAGRTRTYPGLYRGTDPDVVNALNAIPECVRAAGQNWVEFPLTDPILEAGTIDFDENNPNPQGADRVVAKADGDGNATPFSNFVYCSSMTHRGVDGNLFAPCV